MFNYALRPFKHTAARLRGIAHFVTPARHANSGKFNRVRPAALTKRTTSTQKHWGGAL